MKTISLLFVIIAALSFKSAPRTTWALDEAHSNLRFEGTHLMVSKIEGSVVNDLYQITKSDHERS